MLTEAAVLSAEVERWVQADVVAKSRAMDELSPELAEANREAKKESYEVTVVDQFRRLGGVSFAAHGSIAAWERPFRTGEKGRPVAVDICLFNGQQNEETRIEFGRYTLGKLKDDSKKLAKLGGGEAFAVKRFVILWNVAMSGVSVTDKAWATKCTDAAASATTATFAVNMMLATEQDLFSTEHLERRKVQVGLFSVTATNDAGDGVPT